MERKNRDRQTEKRREETMKEREPSKERRTGAGLINGQKEKRRTRKELPTAARPMNKTMVAGSLPPPPRVTLGCDGAR